MKYFYLLGLLFFFSCGDDSPEADVPVTGVSILPANAILSIGATVQLDVDVLPANATNKSVSWSSSNESVATVDVNGLVEGITAGDATITATTQNGSHSAQIEITVTSTSTGNQISHGGKVWDLFNSSVYTIKTNDATTLQLDLAQNALWFNGSQGGLIYQTVTGDFTFTANVNAVKRTNNNEAPDCEVCLGGLMVRNPSGASENYVHLVTGFTPGGLGAETKSTTNSTSVYVPTAPGQLPHTDGHTRHDLRIVRTGNSFTLSKKSDADADWVVLTTYDRPDLPATVTVGLNIYTSVGGGSVADLSVIYQNITIAQ